LLFGEDLFGNHAKPPSGGVIRDKFIAPPFSVLNARDGAWNTRKQAWLRFGIASEVGRLGIDKKLNKSDKDDYQRLVVNSGKGAGVKDGVSIFDPVLCEIAYKWFCPPKGQIVDPFAGGSVRGIVAAASGYKYWGADLSSNQIDQNYTQAHKLNLANMPKWVCGNSMEVLQDAPPADFIFSCPPYGDLEKYSDHQDDLSNMDYHAFVAAYRRIILKSLKCLKQDRFACFVVGDFRDKKGFYRNFVSETITAFEMLEAKLYNEAILVTKVGSAAMRVNRQFNAGRKLCKTHQNVLVFCKGDWKKATLACGEI
jgi:DNA modification methylase